MGYGPLVRSSCGVTALWRDPDCDLDDPTGACDGFTVYPDHISAYIAAIAVLAAVIGRARTGRGALVETAQADVAVMHLGSLLAAESVPPGTAGVFRCAGDDEWCVIDVRDDDDWRRLAAQIGIPALAATDFDTATVRLQRRAEIETAIGEWTAQRSPMTVMSTLQAVGVPAATMLRLPDLLTDSHMCARDSFHLMTHPLLPRPVPANARVARFSTIPDAPQRPAPAAGQHTREICETLLALDSSVVHRLVRAGVLEVPDETASGQVTA